MHTNNGAPYIDTFKELFYPATLPWFEKTTQYIELLHPQGEYVQLLKQLVPYCFGYSILQMMYYIFPNYFCNNKEVIITEIAKILTNDSQESDDARPRLW